MMRRRALLEHVLLPCLRFAPVEVQAEWLAERIPHLLRVVHQDARPGNIPGLRQCAPRPRHQPVMFG